MPYAQYGYTNHVPNDNNRYNANRAIVGANVETSKTVDSKGKIGERGATDEAEYAIIQAEIVSPDVDAARSSEPLAANKVNRTANPTDISSSTELGDSVGKTDEKTVVLPDDDVDNTISFLAEDNSPAPSVDRSAAPENMQVKVVNSSGVSWEDSEHVIDDNAIDFMGGDADVRNEVTANGSSHQNQKESSTAGSPAPSEHSSSERLLDDKRDKDPDDQSKVARKVSFERRGAISDDTGVWRKERQAPVAKVQKYTKEEIVALYERGAQAPSEIKSNYPDARERGPVVVIPKSVPRQTSGGSRRALGGSRSSTPNLSPEDLALFNPNKENVFKYK